MTGKEARQAIPVVLKVNPQEPEPRLLEVASYVITRGGLVVYPTDTVYGLATNPFDLMSVVRLFDAKRRPMVKPIPLIASSLSDAARVVEVDEVFMEFATRFWPGPLTIVGRVRSWLPPQVTGFTDKVGVRVPDCLLARQLAKLAGGLITGTSANISGMPPPLVAEEAVRQLGSFLDLVLDAGKTGGGTPSTVIDVSEGVVKVLRLGPVGVEEVEEVARGLGIEVQV